MRCSCINAASHVGAGGDGWVFLGTSVFNGGVPNYVFMCSAHAGTVDSCQPCTLAQAGTSAQSCTQSNPTPRTLLLLSGTHSKWPSRICLEAMLYCQCLQICQWYSAGLFQHMQESMP